MSKERFSEAAPGDILLDGWWNSVPSHYPHPSGGLAALGHLPFLSARLCVGVATVLSAVRLSKDGELREDPWELAAGLGGLRREP